MCDQAHVTLEGRCNIKDMTLVSPGASERFNDRSLLAAGLIFAWRPYGLVALLYENHLQETDAPLEARDALFGVGRRRCGAAKEHGPKASDLALTVTVTKTT